MAWVNWKQKKKYFNDRLLDSDNEGYSQLGIQIMQLAIAMQAWSGKRKKTDSSWFSISSIIYNKPSVSKSHLHMVFASAQIYNFII